MKQVPVLQNYNKHVKGVCADMLTEAGGSKKRKEEFARQYDKKYLRFDFTVAHVVNKCSDPYVFYAPKFIKRCNETFLTCSVVVIFIRSTAIFKASHWYYFPRRF